MSTADIERALVEWIGRFFEWPSATLAVLCLTLTALCYAVLPPQAGIPIVVIVAMLPWYEARLQRRLEQRDAAGGQTHPARQQQEGQR
jgi:hypothetical protein